MSLDRRCACSKAALYFLHEVQDVKDKLNKEMGLGRYLAINVNHSLFTHPVGFHLDAFSRYGCGDVIENKICLLNVDKNNKTSEYALRHGGCGPGKYVYSILDWGSGVSSGKHTSDSGIDLNDDQQSWKSLLASIPL